MIFTLLKNLMIQTLLKINLKEDLENKILLDFLELEQNYQNESLFV